MSDQIHPPALRLLPWLPTAPNGGLVPLISGQSDDPKQSRLDRVPRFLHVLTAIHAVGAVACFTMAYAKAAGILLLVTIVTGFFGEFYVPSNLISSDAATTVANITAHESLFRLGFAAYLIEACCAIALALAFYVLLKPVNNYLALLTAFFGLVSTATFAITQLMYFGALPIQQNLQSFGPDQVASVAQMSVRFYGIGSGIFMVFYGVATTLRGYLMYRSTYFPRVVGGLLALAGIAFIARSFTLVLAPAYASDFLLAPMFFATVTLTGWLLVKGVDVAKWEEVARCTGR